VIVLKKINAFSLPVDLRHPSSFAHRPEEIIAKNESDRQCCKALQE
jgi:hypothetical protein